MEFGILTLATPNDYRKAIGLALSAKVSNPGVPLAVACSPKLREVLSPHFDIVVEEFSHLRGFVHKVYLDQYTPFENTFFFDSDVLLFKDLRPIVQRWAGQSYTASGEYMTSGFSSFGLDRAAVLKKINKPELAVIDGAGHAFFRKPQCAEVFELARYVTEHHAEYAGNIHYADEDVLDIVMTMLDLAPAPGHDFFSRHLTAVKGTLDMDARTGTCKMVAQHSSLSFEPYMMHFASDEAPFRYAYELSRLFRAHGVKEPGLLTEAARDYLTRELYWPLKSYAKRLLNK